MHVNIVHRNGITNFLYGLDEFSNIKEATSFKLNDSVDKQEPVQGKINLFLVDENTQ